MSKKNKKVEAVVKHEVVVTGQNEVSAPTIKKQVLTAQDIEAIQKEYKAQQELEASIRAKKKELKEKAEALGVALKAQRVTGPTAKSYIEELLAKDPNMKSNQIARTIILDHPDTNPFTVVAAVQKFFRAAKGAEDEAAPVGE